MNLKEEIIKKKYIRSINEFKKKSNSKNNSSELSLNKYELSKNESTLFLSLTYIKNIFKKVKL